MDGNWQTRFPLTGIREASIAPLQQLLQHAVQTLGSDERVQALWLGGSFADGRADPFSDLDLHCCVDDTVFAALHPDSWKDFVHAFTDFVMASTFPGGDIGGYALTPEWLHVDLSVHRQTGLEFPADLPVMPLFDRIGIVPERAPHAIVQGAPYFPNQAVNLYLYLFGKMPAVVARNEPILLNNGVVAERDICLTQLFYGERGVRHAGGAKRVRPFLSSEQYEALVTLPPLDGTLDTCIEACLAVARLFIPRGRRLAATTGSVWPKELERATVSHVEHSLGVPIGIPG